MAIYFSGDVPQKFVSARMEARRNRGGSGRRRIHKPAAEVATSERDEKWRGDRKMYTETSRELHRGQEITVASSDFQGGRANAFSKGRRGEINFLEARAKLRSREEFFVNFLTRAFKHIALLFVVVVFSPMEELNSEERALQWYKN